MTSKDTMQKDWLECCSSVPIKVRQQERRQSASPRTPPRGTAPPPTQPRTKNEETKFPRASTSRNVPDGLPAVIDVPQDKGDADTGNDASPNIFIHGFLGDSNVTEGRQCLHGEQRSQQRGQVVKEQLAQTAKVTARHSQAGTEPFEFAPDPAADRLAFRFFRRHVGLLRLTWRFLPLNCSCLRVNTQLLSVEQRKRFCEIDEVDRELVGTR